MKVFLGSGDNDADIDETSIVKCSVGADVAVEVAVFGVLFKIQGDAPLEIIDFVALVAHGC